MTPVQQGSYRFRKESIAEMRQRLGLSQTAMALMLAVPKNTVSRWERGETTPDADSLAAIYSLGMDKGFDPNFFAPLKQKAAARDAALVYWDMQTIAPASVGAVDALDRAIRKEVDQRVPRGARRLFKAFSHPVHSAMTDRLMTLKWGVWEDNDDLTEDILHHALSDAGQDPSGSVVYLIAADGRLETLIQELRDRNVRVYVMTLHGYDVRPGVIMSTDVWTAAMTMAPWPPSGRIDGAQEINVEVKRR